MALNATFLLELAGIPFCLDKGSTLPKDGGPSLAERLDRMLPCRQLRSYAAAPLFPGRTAAALAPPQFESAGPTPDVRIGEWHYPSAGRRWSVFRGLMTSLMVKQLLSVVGAGGTGTFTMKAKPDTPAARANDYTLSTTMMLLPPRPLAEHGGAFDGLYLVELVDERFDWQTQPLSLTVTRSTTWAELISAWAAAVNVSVSYSAISAAYGQPEPDSELFCRGESAALLIDAIAANVGRALVRNLDGTYALLSPQESYARAQASRGVGTRVVRTAGGDLFASGVATRAGNLSLARNYVVPDTVTLSFPRYVWGPDPVPHALDPRPGTLYQRVGPGEHYQVSVPVRSGGVAVSGLTGAGGYVIQDTAKALYSGEADAAPFNASGLTALALQAAGDYYAAQALASLDEVYEGTYAWTPEGLHDVVWTYSHEAGGAKTRVMRQEWTARTKELQHAAPPLSGRTTLGRGFGGPPVALTVRDQNDGSAATTLSGSMASGAAAACLVGLTGLPAADRWKGLIGDEKVLFEAASGGFNVGVAARGIDDTVQEAHAAGSVVRRLYPTEVYGINLITCRNGLRVYPGAFTSGGLREAILDAAASGASTTYDGATITYNYTDVVFNSGSTITINAGVNLEFVGGDVVYYSGSTISYGSGIVVTNYYNQAQTNYYGGSVQNFYSGALTQVSGDGSWYLYGSGNTYAFGGDSFTQVNLSWPTVNLTSGSVWTLDEGGSLYLNGYSEICSWWGWCYESGPLLTTVQTNLAAPAKPVTRVRIDDNIPLRGIATRGPTQRTTWINVGSGTATITNLDGSATYASGQIITPTTASITWGPNQTIETWYDPVDGKTRVLGGTAITASGGGGAGGVGTELYNNSGFTASSGVSFAMSGYAWYKIVAHDLLSDQPGGAVLRLRVSSDGGSTWASGATDYNTSGGLSNHLVVGSVAGSGNASLEMTVFNPVSGNFGKLFTWTYASTALGAMPSWQGYYRSDDAFDAVLLLPAAGNFNGSIKVYGYA